MAAFPIGGARIRIHVVNRLDPSSARRVAWAVGLGPPFPGGGVGRLLQLSRVAAEPRQVRPSFAPTIALARDPGRLRFQVADDGVGYAATTSYGTGLQGMADRLDAIGGSLEIRSTPGSGTTIVGTIPVS